MSMFNPSTQMFDGSQINQLGIFIDNQQWPDVYQYIRDILLSQDPNTQEPYIAASASIHQSQIFMDGAACINDGIGIYSAFVRTYTGTQGVLRHHEAIPSTDMQDASDAVAEAILSNVRQSSKLSTLTDIAEDDSLTIRDILFPELDETTRPSPA
jgi:hypothetical protein